VQTFRNAGQEPIELSFTDERGDDVTLSIGPGATFLIPSGTAFEKALRKVKGAKVAPVP
jgi:hypothetical protein